MMRSDRRAAVLLLGLAWIHTTAQADKPEVVIDAPGVPPAALQVIVKSVDVIAQQAEDQDVGEASRLRRRARDATIAALETQGYFSAEVTLDAVTDALGEAWDITIEPRARTLVESVQISFQGSIAHVAHLERVEALRAQWPLKPGADFINTAWGDAKTNLLTQVRQRDFYFAHFTRTQATVEAAAARAQLEVLLESGPRVLLGDLQVEGLQRVPRTLIDRYVRYTPGDAYDQERLDAWQQGLQSTQFFRGAFVSVDAQDGTEYDPQAEVVVLPLAVRVTEAPTQRLSASLGFDTDQYWRVEGVYRQNIVFGYPVWIETGAGLAKDEQRVFFDWHLPPNPGGYQDSFGLLYKHTDIQGLNSRRTGLGWKRRQERTPLGDARVAYETQWDVIAVHESQEFEDADEENVRMSSAIATWQWLRSNVDNRYDPRSGNLIDVGLGAGVNLDRTEFFYRTSVRGQLWWPVGRRHNLTLRAEIGKVWATTTRVPTDFGYRAGGSRSLRGYGYQALGLARGNAIVGAPAMALVSMEYNHYINELFGVALFVDAGDAAASYQQMEWALGYGVGARVRTPAGPFQVDVAYGQRDRRLRFHMSLGIAF